MSNTYISVLIPIYNGIEFIEESVSSVINQTYPYWELLIAVNGHPPNSSVYIRAKEYEQRHPNIRVLDFYTIKGKSNTLNAMVPLCNYDHIALLDVDDIWHPNKLEKQSEYINKYDVVGTQCVYFGESYPIVPYIPVGDITKFDFKTVDPIINSSSITRKSLVYWRGEWDGVEDYDLWLTLNTKKCTFYNVPEILVKHRIHKKSAFNANGNNLQVPNLLKYHYG